MDDLSPAAAEQLARLDEQMAEVKRRADRAAQLRDEVDALRETGTSQGREVSVEVDSIGRLVSLTLTNAASGLAPDDLAALILDTVSAARQRAGSAVMAKVEDAFGAYSETAAAMRPTYLPPPPNPEDEGRKPGPGQGPMLYTRR